MLTAERLKELLHYDPDTGVFTWRVTRGRGSVGALAGRIMAKGYIQIGIDDELYLAHRLAFLFMTGEWPKSEVDHRDLDKANNRWANLREATRSQNEANKRPTNKLGVKGVCWHAKDKKWQAQIRHNGKTIYLGSFATIAEAKAIYDLAARDLHGEFARAS